MTEFWNQRWFRDALPYAAGALAAAGAVAGYGASQGWFSGSSSAGSLPTGGDGSFSGSSYGGSLPSSVSVAMGEPIQSFTSGGDGGSTFGAGSLYGSPDPSLPLPPPEPPGEGILSRIVNSGIPGVQTVTQMIAENPQLAMTAALTGAAMLSGGGNERRPPDPRKEEEERRRRDRERWESYRVDPVRPLTYSRPATARGERLYFSAGGALREDDAIRGAGDGMSDDIPAVAVSRDGNERQIYVADGEYIIAADVVSGLGNGSSEAGVRLLDEFQRRVRERRATSGEQPRAINPAAALPA